MRSRLTSPPDRRGALLPVAAVSLSVVLVYVAFVIDIGVICVAREEAQNCADAAALAAALELYPDPKPQTALKLPLSLPIYKPYCPSQNLAPCVSAASSVSGLNVVGHKSGMNLLNSDILFQTYDGGGLVGPPSTLTQVDNLLNALKLRTGDNTFVNCCTVVVRRDEQANGSLRLFMAPFTSRKTHSVSGRATAVIQRGYGVGPGDKVLPFALDITIWNAIRFTNSEINAITLKPLGVDLDAVTISGLLGNNALLSLLNSALPLALLGSPLHVLDGCTVKRGSPTVTNGPDGIYEAVLLPDQFHSTFLLSLLGKLLPVVQRIPGLVVSLETSTINSSTPNAARLNTVIRDGLSVADIARLSTTADGQAWLPFTCKGYFEIPNECEASLKSIIGQPRILPLYATLPGTVSKATDILGASHSFQIVGWAGVVITEVNLSGQLRYINIQPAIYNRHTVSPAAGSQAWRSNSHLSDGVYTSPRLIK
ncbi:pilus assembly protein TadG-related protein [Planctomicrobium sp. SH664]|uniref:pilus assembly protein TadG-related protein n=1 Tax=Planctomicrobium sp. SH664 TaxID=3448125 RepID=UPI003F5B78B7